MIVWEIVVESGERGFYRYDDLCPKILFYVNREKAERIAEAWAAARRLTTFSDRIAHRDEDDRERPEVDDWWASEPPLNIVRTEENTGYLIGEINWSDRDPRGRFLGLVRSVEVDDGH